MKSILLRGLSKCLTYINQKIIVFLEVGFKIFLETSVINYRFKFVNASADKTKKCSKRNI